MSDGSDLRTTIYMGRDSGDEMKGNLPMAHTVVMTRGGDTIYVPAEQQDAFEREGYSAPEQEQPTPDDKPVPHTYPVAARGADAK